MSEREPSSGVHADRGNNATLRRLQAGRLGTVERAEGREEQKQEEHANRYVLAAPGGARGLATSPLRHFASFVLSCFHPLIL
jgi:hypothetical protein